MNWILTSEVLGALLLTATILPRVSLWLLRRSAFSRTFLLRADEALKRWDRILAHDCQEISGTVRGAFSANESRFIGGTIGFVAWPLVVVLNSLVLAQIMELFVPTSGDPIFLPGFGECEPMAVVLALIVALCDALLAVAAWHHSDRRMRLLAFTGCAAAIGFEMYGGWLRSTIMGGLQSQDGVLAGHSALVSALIGFIAPTAEMLGSVMSYEGILVSQGLTFMRIPRAALLWGMLRTSRLILGTSLERRWINLNPQVAEAANESHGFLTAAERLLQAAWQLTADVDEVATQARQQSKSSSEASESAEGGLASKQPDEVVQAYKERIRQLRQEGAYVKPKGPHRWMSRRQLRDYRQQRKWQSRRIRALISQPEQRAHEDALRELDAIQLARASGGKAGNHRSWQRLRAQADSLRGRATDLACESTRLASQVQETLTNLNLVMSGRMLDDFDQYSQEENLRLAALIQNRCQGESGATTMLAQCAPVSAAAAEKLDRINQIMGGRGLGPESSLADLAASPHGLAGSQSEIETERSRFAIDIDLLMEQILECERDARALQFRLTPWGKVWGWVAGWPEDDDPVDAWQRRPEDEDSRAAN